MKITSIQSDLFAIPLPEVLTDSTHGEMRDFALVTARVTCDDGSDGRADDDHDEGLGVHRAPA